MVHFHCFKYLFVKISIFVRKRNVTPLEETGVNYFLQLYNFYNSLQRPLFSVRKPGCCGEVQLYFEKRIEAVHTFVSACSLLQEKRKELGDAASKLRNGLDKIDDTRAKVLTKGYCVTFLA